MNLTTIKEQFGTQFTSTIRGALDDIFKVVRDNPILEPHSGAVSRLVTGEIQRRLPKIDGVTAASGNRTDFTLRVDGSHYVFRLNRAHLPSGGTRRDYDPNQLNFTPNGSNASCRFDFVVLWLGDKNGLIDAWALVPAGQAEARPKTQMAQLKKVNGRRWSAMVRLTPEAVNLDQLTVDPIDPPMDLGQSDDSADSGMAG